MKPFVCDIPYPTIDNLTLDVKSGQIISFAYATAKGELTAILQYVYHSFHMANFNKEDAEILVAIALAEMKHLDILGQSMLKLGVNPKFVQFPNSKVYYDTSCVAESTTPSKMIMDDIAGELNAISEYNKMLFVLKNEEVSAIIQRIKMDEELHLEALKQMLQRYAPRTT